MKKFLGLNLVLIFCFFANFISSDEIKDSLSQTLGHLIKEEMDKCQYDIDIDKVIEGIIEAKKGASPPLSREEFTDLISDISERKIKNREQEKLQIANDFFQSNKKNKNVIELIEKKLQYIILSEGSGEKVDYYHSPVISIKGSFLDNTVFLSQPEYVISLNELPEGLKMAIKGMKEKEKRRIFIHSDFTKGFFDSPFHSILIYEIEVLKNDKSKIFPLQSQLAEKNGTFR